jgi:hypothetical protein
MRFHAVFMRLFDLRSESINYLKAFTKMAPDYGIQDGYFEGVTGADLRLESGPSRYCGTGEARESEDHAGSSDCNDGNGVRGSKGIQRRSSSPLPA